MDHGGRAAACMLAAGLSLGLGPRPGDVGASHDQEFPPDPLVELAAVARADCTDGFAGGFPCRDVDLLAFLPRRDMGAFAVSLSDLWGWTDPETGREYALVGTTNATSFVDVTVPHDPVYLGQLPTHSGPRVWRDIKVYANHAFIVSEAAAHGMQVFDLTQLRGVIAPPVTFSETAHYAEQGLSNSHNIAIDEESGFAYLVGTNTCGKGLHMVDIRDPQHPTFAGCFADDGYTHDTQCVVYRGADTEHVGRQICVSSNEDTITIVDVTDKLAPRMLSRSSYPGFGYMHQAWLTPDHLYLLSDDELDELSFGHGTRTYVWTMADLDSPSLIGIHESSVPATDHNLYIRDGIAYQANYRAGLRVLDLAGIGAGILSERGFLDVVPESDAPGFSGTWSVYPFFPSGNVIVSGIEQGLFVVRPRLD